MTKSTHSQWPAPPAFNFPYINLVDCVSAAIKHFLHRRSIVFVILYQIRLDRWFLMPWSQYRHISPAHEAATAPTIFRGTFDQLRSIAQSFPLDMFAQQPSDADIDDTTETPSAPDGAAKTDKELLDEAKSTPVYPNPTADKPDSHNDRHQMDDAKQKLRDLDDAAAPSSDDDSATSKRFMDH